MWVIWRRRWWSGWWGRNNISGRRCIRCLRRCYSWGLQCRFRRNFIKWKRCQTKVRIAKAKSKMNRLRLSSHSRQIPFPHLPIKNHLLHHSRQRSHPPSLSLSTSPSHQSLQRLPAITTRGRGVSRPIPSQRLSTSPNYSDYLKDKSNSSLLSTNRNSPIKPNTPKRWTTSRTLISISRKGRSSFNRNT